jgi:hypothetical protein
LASVLDDPIASSDVVQREIAERVNYLITQGSWYSERSAIN